MKIVVNGVEEQWGVGVTVRGVVEGKGMNVEKVAVEVNRRLVRSAGGGYERELKEGDVVEIVTFVGGG